jgi:ribosome-associated translation inhibitor RaiA
MEPIPNIESHVRRHVERLADTFARIEKCRVVVDLPHRHHRNGNHFHVRIHVAIPGDDVVVDHEPGRVPSADDSQLAKQSEQAVVHRELDLALRDAFDAARRQLKVRAERMRGDVKAHIRSSGRRS